MTPHRVLVTGSSGFLGQAIVARLLAQGHVVMGLDPAPPVGATYQHFNDDLLDGERLRSLLLAERLTHIVHAGGVSGPMVMSDDPARIMTINVIGSMNLLMAARASNVKTFVYCSSLSAIGDYYEPFPISDDYPLRPNSAYGCSKAAFDMVLRGLYVRIPLDLCSLRFTGIYGPGRKTAFVIDDIVAGAIEGRPVRASASSDWPYIYVDDAADAAIAACFSESRKQLFYLLSYPEQVALIDLADAAGLTTLDVDGSQPEFRRGPVDIEPAIRDFGFAPKIDHREGIKRMIAARHETIPPRLPG